MGMKRIVNKAAGLMSVLRAQVCGKVEEISLARRIRRRMETSRGATCEACPWCGARIDCTYEHCHKCGRKLI